MKRTYKTPEIEVEKFSIVNVATLSSSGNAGNEGSIDGIMLDDESSYDDTGLIF